MTALDKGVVLQLEPVSVRADSTALTAAKVQLFLGILICNIISYVLASLVKI